ncbi:MAG: P-loop NTPase [bacterium]
MASKPTIWAVGGGKGGIGKSIICSNLGVGLAAKNYSVIIIDLDLGSANIHTLLGVKKVSRSINDFLSRRFSLEEIALTSPQKNLKIISGGNGILGIANLKYLQKDKLIRHLCKLDADFVLLDLPAGINYNVIDFFGIADEKIVVSCADPMTIQNTYGFIKSTLYRQVSRLFGNNVKLAPMLAELAKPKSIRTIHNMSELQEKVNRIRPDMEKKLNSILTDYKPGLLANMLVKHDEGKHVFSMIPVAKKYLNIDISTLGKLSHDLNIHDSVARMTPFMSETNSGKSKRHLNTILGFLLNKHFKKAGVSLSGGSRCMQ